MIESPAVSFAALDDALERTAVVLVAPDLAMGSTAKKLDEKSDGALKRAAKAADFKGTAKAAIELLGPRGIDVSRLLAVGTGPIAELAGQARIDLGGAVMGVVQARKTETVSVIAEVAGLGKGEAADLAADMALGALLRAYSFRKHRSKKTKANGIGPANGDGGNGGEGPAGLVVHCADPKAAEKAFEARRAVAEGVTLARDLVNEPANKLGPLEFAAEIEKLRAHGLDVEILEEEALRDLGMGALLAVSQGSERPARVAVMQWHGAPTAKGGKSKGKAAGKGPLCFVGKGVCFDTGGISMKPAAGMEDMKGDMGGAAAVTGLMLALALRKAPVNAVGLVGLVENMPSGTATRPGDIVTSMSGQTIEVLNTDAEGRLVLADVIWYAQDRFKPRFIVDLATLTGAIMIALGKEYAGLFANDDALAEALAAAGEATGEKVWRMPLGKAYDKLIDSKSADMKNIGGRFGGAITGAQFVQRFVKDGTAWAHLDVAGVAMDSGKTDISQSWASGWGVRLLDRLASEHEE